MEISYQCTLDDYEEAINSHARLPLGSGFLAVGGLFFFLLGIGAVVNSGLSVTALAAISAGGLATVPLTLRVLQGLWIKKDFDKHPGFSGRAQLSVDTDGLRTESDLERRETKWPAFTKYRETENLFILYEGARLLRVFPKRAFANQQLGEFRKFLASKVASR